MPTPRTVTETLNFAIYKKCQNMVYKDIENRGLSNLNTPVIQFCTATKEGYLWENINKRPQVLQ